MGEVVEVSVDVANLVERFRLVKDKYDAIAVATGERFNVFEVLGVERDEVKTHSAMLAELLDPRGSHAQGAVFLRLFVEVLQLKCLSDVELDDFEVTTEASRGDFGRIDILIENSGSNKKCVVIENKIGAGGSWEQLGRYDGYARKVCDNDKERFKVIYLTLDRNEPEGDAPDDEGLKKRVLCVSHGKHIVEWLERCIEKMARVARVRETMLQYQSVLKELTNQPMSRRFIMDANKFFSRPENCKLVPALEQAISAFNVNLQRMLWKEISNQLSDQLDITLRGVHDYGYWRCADLNAVDNTSICSEISINFDGRVQYSFRACDEKYNVIKKGYGDEKYAKVREAANKANLITDVNWCFGYEYLQNGETLGKPNKIVIQKLVCVDQRKKIVEQLISEMNVFKNSFLKALNSA